MKYLRSGVIAVILAWAVALSQTPSLPVNGACAPLPANYVFVATPAGGGPTVCVAVIDGETLDGVADSVNPYFRVAKAPIPASLHIYRNGIRLKMGLDYNVGAGRTITFRYLPAPGDVLIADYWRIL